MLCTLKQNFRRSFAVNWNLIGSLKNQQKKGHALVAWNVESKYNFHQLHPHLHGFWFRTTSKIKGQRLPSFFCQTNLRIAATFDSKKGGNSLILKKHILAIFQKSVQSFPKNKNLALLFHYFFTILNLFSTTILQQTNHRNSFSKKNFTLAFYQICPKLPKRQNLALLDTIFSHHFLSNKNTNSRHTNHIFDSKKDWCSHSLKNHILAFFQNQSKKLQIT